MSNLLPLIQADTIQALKNNNPAKVSTLRLLTSALQNEKIALGRELTNQDITAVIHRQIKQRKEAAEFYQSAGQIEKGKQELAEIDYMNIYLPPLLSTEEINRIIAKSAQKTGATSIANFGQLMKEVMTMVKGQADGQRVKQLVENYLKRHASN